MSSSDGRRAGAAAPATERVARLAGALADARRVRVLFFLRAGPATVSEISAALGLPTAQTSLHLAKLRDRGLVRAERQGRHRIYSADPDPLRRLAKGLEELTRGERTAPAGPGARPSRPAQIDPALRRARTCYDHLAGTAAVDLVSRMERRGWLLRRASGFLPTEKGGRQLMRRGVNVAACREMRRKLAPGCLDWTERRWHLGGALGAAVLDSLVQQGYVESTSGRHLRIRRAVTGWLR